MFYEYIFIKLVYFHLKYYELFLVKVVVASSQQVKSSISLPFDVTVNTNCDVTMGKCLSNKKMYVMLEG